MSNNTCLYVSDMSVNKQAASDLVWAAYTRCDTRSTCLDLSLHSSWPLLAGSLFAFSKRTMNGEWQRKPIASCKSSLVRSRACLFATPRVLTKNKHAPDSWLRDEHGFGPSMGWIGLRRVEILANNLGWVWVGLDRLNKRVNFISVIVVAVSVAVLVKNVEGCGWFCKTIRNGNLYDLGRFCIFEFATFNWYM